MSLLEITDLRTEIQLRTRVVKAVDGVTLTVEPGETVGPGGGVRLRQDHDRHRR